MKNTNKSEIANSLINASNIVEELGKLKLRNGCTLKDAITIKGISFWTVAETDMALHALPNILFRKQSFLNNKIKLYLFIRHAKYKFINLKHFIFSNYNNFEIKNKNAFWFIIGFTEYIYRDTLEPLFDFIKKTEYDIQPIKIKNLLNQELNVNKIELLKEYRSLNKEINKSKKYLLDNGLLELGKKQKIVTNEEFLLIIYWIYNILISKLKYDTLITLRNLNYYKPEIIISGDMADSRNRLYLLFAKLFCIPTLDLQFGAYDESSIEWRFSISDKIGVWGEYFSEIFLNQMKIPINKIEITGSPRFDYLYNIDTSKNKVEIESKSKKVILFASMYTQISSYDARYHLSLIDKFKLDLIGLIKKNKEILLLIKPHPLENISWIPNLEDFNNIRIIQSFKDIRDYISVCDVFVTFGSTATFDALLANKTVVSANYPGLVWWDDIFLKEKVTLPVSNLVELSDYLCNNIDHNNILINEISTNKNLFMNKCITNNIKNSSERIVSLSKSMIYNNNTEKC